MNRREALAALIALPEIARISTVPITPTDVIVIECDKCLSSDVRERLAATVRDVWPGRKVVVLDQSLKLKIVAGTEASHV